MPWKAGCSCRHCAALLFFGICISTLSLVAASPAEQGNWDPSKVMSHYLNLPWRPYPTSPEQTETFHKSCKESPYYELSKLLKDRTTDEANAILHDTISYYNFDLPKKEDSPTNTKATLLHALSKAKKCKERKTLRTRSDMCSPTFLCVLPTTQSPKLPKVKSVTTFNELGYDLIGYVPYAYHLALQGELKYTDSVVDSVAFWFFSPKHCVLTNHTQRIAGPVKGTSWPTRGDNRLANKGVTAQLFPLKDYVAPPFYAHYCGWGVWPFSGKRYIMIFTKHNAQEWQAGPVNFYGIPTLKSMLDLLLPHYTVVYHRAVNGLFDSEPTGFNPDLSDFSSLKDHVDQKYPEYADRLVLLPNLLKEMIDYYKKHYPSDNQSSYSPLSVNELLNSAMADADGVITIQGGPNYITSLYGNGGDYSAIEFERKGMEVTNNAFRWYPLISGVKYHYTRNESQVLTLIKRVYVKPLTHKKTLPKRLIT